MKNKLCAALCVSILGITQMMCNISPQAKGGPEIIVTPVYINHVLPIPESVFCEKHGNRFELRTSNDGSKIGVCIFPDGSACPATAYFTGGCGFITIPTQDMEQTIVEVVKIVLADKLNLGVNQINLYSMERVTWMDDCLAIQWSGDICNLVETPGFRVILQVGDDYFTYHTNLTGDKIREESGGRHPD